MSQDQNNGHPSPKVCVVLPVLEDSRIQVPKASISQWEIYRVIDSLKQALNRTARKKKNYSQAPNFFQVAIDNSPSLRDHHMTLPLVRFGIDKIWTSKIVMDVNFDNTD